MGDLTIRDAEARDARAIAKIQVNASRVAYAGIFSTVSSTMTVESRIPVWQDFIAVAGGQQRLLVAEQSAEICGYAHFGPTRDRDQSASPAELYSIYVTPERWRHGIGSRLLIQSTKMLGEAGFASCTLWVLAQNGNARRFYARHGWRSDGTERPVDGQVSEVRYRKEELLLERLGSACARGTGG
jgi:ribosomal protein S18 acetylase RimI-like enzyme